MGSQSKPAVLILTALLLGCGFCTKVFACGDHRIAAVSHYRSPSGQFVLRVEPSNEWGEGSAQYELLKNGAAVWQKQLPFTLFEVCMLNDGTSAGYGYTAGKAARDRRHADDCGDLVVVILDSEGSIIAEEGFHRRMIPGPHAATTQLPVPEAKSLVVSAENDQLLFLANYSPLQFEKQSVIAWRTYRLSTGKPLGVYYPEERLGNGSPCYLLPRKPVPLPGTSLYVVQWQRWEGEFPNWIFGAHFALLDHECNPVWQLALPGDYDMPADGSRSGGLWSWSCDNGAILSVASKGRFDLYCAQQGQRVSFAAAKNEQGKWIVTEIGRKDFTPPGMLASPGNSEKPATASTGE